MVNRRLIFLLIWKIFLEELLSFHRKLYDLKIKGSPASKPKVPLSTQTSIHYFPKHNVSFCLPPKSGSTSWLLSIEPLADENKKDPKAIIYQRLPRLTKSELVNHLAGVQKTRKILNTRNPLTRTFSAWKDKYRFNQERLIYNLFKNRQLKFWGLKVSSDILLSPAAWFSMHKVLQSMHTLLQSIAGQGKFFDYFKQVFST